MPLPDYPVPSAQYFMERPWWTPNQIRDSLLTRHEVTTSLVQECRVLAIQEQARRKTLPEYVECPRCRGHHGQLENLESLCERCEAQTAPSRYDALLKGGTDEKV